MAVKDNRNQTIKDAVDVFEKNVSHLELCLKNDWTHVHEYDRFYAKLSAAKEQSCTELVGHAITLLTSLRSVLDRKLTELSYIQDVSVKLEKLLDVCEIEINFLQRHAEYFPPTELEPLLEELFNMREELLNEIDSDNNSCMSDSMYGNISIVLSAEETAGFLRSLSECKVTAKDVVRELEESDSSLSSRI